MGMKGLFMKRFLLCAIIVFLSGIITGCSFDLRSQIEGNLQESMKKNSRVLSDPDYKNASSLKKEGKLDDEDKYNDQVDLGEFDSEEVTLEEERGDVRVTLAENEYISIAYYWDQDHSQKIDSDECFLNPGETIYAVIQKINNPYTDCYKFDSIRVIEYDTEGKRGNCIGGFEGDETLSFSLSEFYSGTDIVLEPVGKYEKRYIQLDSYWNSTEGHKEVGGNWVINQKEAIEGTNEVDSSLDYIIAFKYDPTKYYYVSSSPELFSQKEGDIEFCKESRFGGNEKFEVELYPFTTVSIEDKNKAITHIALNGEEIKEKTIELLKVGDKLEITTKRDYKMKGDCDYESYVEGDGENTFTYFIGSIDLESIKLSSSVWDSKTIEIEMESNNGWVSFWNNLVNLLPWANKEEDSPIVFYAGKTKFTYSDLENNKKVVLKENEKLKLIVNKELIKEMPLIITVDGTQHVLSDSSNNELEFSYDEVTTVKIEKE